MKWIKKIPLIMGLIIIFSQANVLAARADDEIEVYKIGNSSITIKWTPYDAGLQDVDKYSVGYRVSGAADYEYVDVQASTQSSEYSSINDEFTKKITDLTSNTIYQIKIDTYIEGNPVPVTFYNSVRTMTKMVIDKEVQTFVNPYGNDTVGHIDFSFIAPNKVVGANTLSVDESNIDGYELTVSNTEGQIYSSGQPYKAIYNGVSSKYDIVRVTATEDPLNFNATQFSFASGIKNGKDLLAFSLYKTNQPSSDNFSLSTIYYVIVQPIFKTGSGYEDIILNATSKYETIETISTLLPISIMQISNDLVKLQFDSVASGSMTYDIYKGRLASSLTKIHKEYDDGTRVTIQYFNKLEDPIEGDIYYFKVVGSNGVASKVIPITITLNPSIAPTISNIGVERIITDTVNDYSDVIISWDKPSNEDANRADLNYRIYLNTYSSNQVFDSDVVYDTSGNIQLDLNGKIMLNTKKDINNNNILFDGLPVVFERIADIDVSNLSNPATVYTGVDPIGNFLTTGCNYYRITRNGLPVVRTIYRVNGQNFLANSDIPLVSGDPHTIYSSKLEGELATDYKTTIKLNTTYYIKLNTLNSSNSQVSDYSLTVSFTTPTDTVDTVPAPASLSAETITTDTIDLIWIPINEDIYDDDDVTYEVYISENGSYNASDFYRIKNPTITTVSGKKHVSVSSYTLDDDVAKTIASNTVYLFKVRAIWATTDTKGNSINLYSSLSEILPVTTKRTTISDPDMTSPPAPVDFATTNVTSKSANFSWSKVDEFSTYRIVRTTSPIDSFAPLSVTGNGVTSGFTLSGSTYTYTDAGLLSNSLYYFAIRSEVVVNTVDSSGNPVQVTLSSAWISIPVTTILVEAPTGLTLVSRSEDGHSIVVKWTGKSSLNYESAKKESDTKNYTISETISGELGSSGSKVFELTLSNLKANTKYLIKVRAKDSETNAYSKYTEPIEVRTEFNQSEYNSDEANREKADIVSEKGQEWINSALEEIGVDENKSELLLKEEKIASQILNSSDSQYTVKVTNSSAKSIIINIPIDVISTLNQLNKNLEIITDRGSYYIKPDILDSEALSEMIDNVSIKSRMLKIQINNLTTAETKQQIKTNDYIASDASSIIIKLVGYDKTNSDINDLISQQVDTIITDQASLVSGRTLKQVEDYLKDSIKEEVKSIYNVSCVSDAALNLQGNKIKIIYKFIPDDIGNTNKYAALIKTDNSSKEVQGEIVDNINYKFETDTLGTMVILGKRIASDLSGSSSSQDINYLINIYDFSNELTNGKFKPNEFATKEDAVNFFINVLGLDGQEYEGLNNIEKAEKIGMLQEFPTWDIKSFITKEESAYLLGQLYSIKTGIDIKTIEIAKEITIKDKNNITDKYLTSVYSMVNEGVMGVNNDKYFYPSNKVTRGDIMTYITKLLRRISQIN